MRKLNLILAILAFTVNTYSSIDTTKSLCLQVQNATHSSSLGTFSPYAVNEFDLIWHNNLWYQFGCSYMGAPNNTYLRVSPTILGLADSPSVAMSTLSGMNVGLLVPTVEMYNDTFYMIAFSVDSNKHFLYKSTTPKTAWIKVTSYQPPPAPYGDCCLRKHGSKWYIAAHNATWNSTRSEVAIFEANNVEGPYTNKGNIFGKGAIPRWIFNTYDTQIYFKYGRCYALAKGASDTTCDMYMVELDTTTFKAIGQPISLPWKKSLTNFLDAVIVDSAGVLRCFYSELKWSSPGSWYYITFNDVSSQPKNNAKLSYPIIIDSGICTIDSNFLFEHDITALSTDPKFKLLNPDSTDIYIWDQDRGIRCSTFIQKTTKNTLNINWKALTSTNRKTFYINVDTSISHINTLPENLLSDIVFDSLPRDRVTGQIPSSAANAVFERGLISGSAKWNGTNNWSVNIDDYRALDNKTQFTVEALFTINGLTDQYTLLYLWGGSVNTSLQIMYRLYCMYISVGTGSAQALDSANWQGYKVNTLGHAVITFNNGAVRMYLNGDSATVGTNAIAKTKTYDLTTTATASFSNANGNTLKGSFSLFRVYSDVKTRSWSKNRFNTLNASGMLLGSADYKKSTGNKKQLFFNKLIFE